MTRKRRPGSRGFGKLLHGLRQATLLFLAFTVLVTLLLRFIPPLATPLMGWRAVEAAWQKKPVKWKKTWRPLEQMSPSLARAVVASEDQRFFSHHGFDLEAIQNAFRANQAGRRKLGASTISQQTAKNLFLWPDRTWLRKGLEVYFTLLLELLWSKKRILEVYLNVVEMGDGVYGMPAAAEKYFGKPAKRLQAEEAALLAACLPAPRRWKPTQLTPYLASRQRWILRQMQQIGPLP